MKTAIIAILALVALAVVGGGGYYFGQAAGLTEATNIRSEFFASRTGSGATGAGTQTGSGTLSAQNARSQATRPIASGTIKAVSGEIIQLTQQDGTSTVVNITAQTVIEKTVTGSPSDLQTGQRISITGDQTNTGINAKVIQITPGTP